LNFLFSLSENIAAIRHKSEASVLFHLLEPRRNDVILHIGYNSGWIANQIAGICDDLYSLEPNEKHLHYVSVKYPQVKAFSATEQSIPFSNNYFDKVCVVKSFHNFPDQDDTLEELRRILKPQGVLLINEIDVSRAGRTKSLSLFIEKRILGHDTANHLTPSELQRLIESHGFKETKIQRSKQDYFLKAKK